jgi:TonB family protein
VAPQLSADEVPIGIVEIPVGVWGSRRGASVGGQLGRIEVFAEETSTVIVFPHGAVIRLSVAVAPGQMMMLTNRESRQVAACRVVKARNYPNVKGYAEIEFFRSTNAFWGDYIPQGTLKLAAPAPERATDDFWSSGVSPEMISVLANAPAASGISSAAARNRAASAGNRANQIHSVEKKERRVITAPAASASPNSLPSRSVASPGKLAVAPERARAREEFASELSWIVEFLRSLRDQSTSGSETDGSLPRRQMALACAAAAILFVAGATGLFIQRRGEAKSAEIAQMNSRPDAFAASSTANTTEGARLESNSGSAGPAVPITTKTENFPGTQNQGLAYNARTSQPEAKAPSLLQKILNSKTLAAPLVAHHPATVIGREVAPNVSGVNSSAGAGAAQGIFAAFMPAGGRVKDARLVVNSAPSYPETAKRVGMEGEVTVSAVIDINGKLTNMKVVSGPPMLQQAALESLKTWKYEPAFLDDKPVPVQTSITVKFRLR